MNMRSTCSIPSLVFGLLCAGALLISPGCCTPEPNLVAVADETPSADQPFTLYLIDGDAGRQEDAPEDELFQGYRILQECPITDEQTRHELFRALDDSIASSPGRGSRCFIPRHGIRVQTNGVVVDYLICFQCGNYRLFEGGKSVSGGGIGREPKRLFNRILAECN